MSAGMATVHGHCACARSPSALGQGCMSRPDVEAAALAEFPELRRLIDLRETGWVFLPRFADGELI
ncbi:MAG: hypothetical protein ACR2FQ_02065 [Pseudonocardiaceae bacterium]